ncbi:AMSH-like ubiquitin thioesterase 1 [Punica granatum]|uniref:AMSH-like ubiquitin thioesterase 1 n=2 Tax=Punica granatum TaxID=22663 RepID=A0A6P8EA08_PUNGR|nr:AMSH-like ubiquitin thioesterase 1 [Punica granatum]
MRSSAGSGRINIAASAQRLDVDNRISLRYYYRIADNILKQADIFREENNVIDLYVMLLRYSSLVTETIPCHRDYRTSLPIAKSSLKKKLLNALTELEKLKPIVQQKIDELNRKHSDQMNGTVYFHQNISSAWTPVRKQTLTHSDTNKVSRPALRGPAYQSLRNQPYSPARPVDDQFRRLSINVLRPKEETLSRHSILGPDGLHGRWQPPSSYGVQYPSNIDLTPVEMPRLRQVQPVEDKPATKEDSSNSEKEAPSLNLVPVVEEVSKVPRAEEEHLMISFDATESTVETKIIRQPSPPPVLAEVQDLIAPASGQLAEPQNGMDNPPREDYICSETPLQLHISTKLMENFMKLAKINTDRNLETCGVLAGSLKNRKFYVTALIIPKQESTSDSCQTTNEEEIFEVQDKQSLFPLGWIHTHPTQSCFMSSIDLHTHYSYQIMLPEAVAIVMAPRDSSRPHGIFRLTTPGGMSVIRQCDRRGFHPHDEPPDGGPIYKSCPDIYMNPNLKFDVIDLR